MNEPLEKSKSRPVFIAGRPRSGTTLLMNVLDTMQGVAIHPMEQHFFTYWGHFYAHRDLNDPTTFEEFMRDYTSHPFFNKRGIPAEVLRERLSLRSPLHMGHVLEAVCAHYAEKTGKPRWGEKTPNHYRHLDVIRTVFPDAQLVLTMRDPRALLASLRRRDFGLRDPYDHALAWVEYVNLIERWKSDPNALIVQYERLVSEPRETVKKICDFLGEPFTENLLEKKSPRGLETVRPESHRYRERAAAVIDGSSLEKWREEITPRQIRITENVAGEAMERWGYARVGGPLTWNDRAIMSIRYGMRPALDLLRGLKRKFSGSPTGVTPG